MPQRGGFGLCVLHVLRDSHVTPPRAPAAHGERRCDGRLLWPISRGAEYGAHVSPARSSAGSCGHSGAPRATGQLTGMKVTQDRGGPHVPAVRLEEPGSVLPARRPLWVQPHQTSCWSPGGGPGGGVVGQRGGLGGPCPTAQSRPPQGCAAPGQGRGPDHASDAPACG